MPKAFTIYWTPKGWSGLREGEPLRLAAGSGFKGKINPGDRVYVTNVKSGQLRVLGSFEVERIQETATEGRPQGATWDGPEYLIARAGTATPLTFAELQEDDIRRLSFAAGKADVTLKTDGMVDGQTMRAIRQLTDESRALLDATLAASLNGEGLTRNGRLPVSVLERATPQHVWWAVQQLLAGTVQHGFDDSNDYDLITDDGERLPPKAVFGVALARALGRTIGPSHFTAGVGSPCFRLLEAAGYRIVDKDATVPADVEYIDDDGKPEWTEGARKLVTHMRRERGRGLARAKKADFRDRNGGRLYCERCSSDPVEAYGSEHGEACIEVHHATTLVSNMQEGAKTRLEDLQCLCANCHRLVHRLLRLGIAT